MITRRDFVRAGTAAGLTLAAAPAIRGADKSDKKYKTALIGCGWWGGNILREAMASGQCRTVGLCDVDRDQIDEKLREVEKLSGDKPKTYKDYRDMLEREKPEIVIVATPDHWHPLAMIDSVKAGAHVYVEKPVGHTILEGRAMVNAARDTGKTVQVGTHRRISPHNVSGREFLRSGKAGKIGMARAFVHYPGGAGQPTPDSEPPDGLDWGMWCGPAPLRPYNKAIHPRGFRHFLDYANGQLGDWGIHWIDQILWIMDEKGPKMVFSNGGRHIKRDSTNAPDTQIASFAFENFDVVWEHRQYAANNAEKHYVGCYFYGTEGTFHMGWEDGWSFYPIDSRKAPIHQDPKLNEPDKQNIKELFADFLDAIKTNRRPVSDIEFGHRSTTMSLLGMLSLKLGRSLAWDVEKERVRGDDEANKHLRREYRAPYQYPAV